MGGMRKNDHKETGVSALPYTSSLLLSLRPLSLGDLNNSQAVRVGKVRSTKNNVVEGQSGSDTTAEHPEPQRLT